MRRGRTLVLLVTAGALTIGMAAQSSPAAQQAQEMVVQIEKLDDRLFVLRGGGGNTG